MPLSSFAKKDLDMQQFWKLKTFFGYSQVALLLSTCILIGCGGGTGKDNARVKVTVTFGGEPIKEGRVDLSNAKAGQGGGGELNASGQVTIDNIPHGEYVVTVVPPLAIPKPPEPGQPRPTVQDYPNIPKKFRVATSSPLRAIVKQGATEFTFELKE